MNTTPNHTHKQNTRAHLDGATQAASRQGVEEWADLHDNEEEETSDDSIGEEEPHQHTIEGSHALVSGWVAVLCGPIVTLQVTVTPVVHFDAGKIAIRLFLLARSSLKPCESQLILGLDRERCL